MEFKPKAKNTARPIPLQRRAGPLTVVALPPTRASLAQGLQRFTSTPVESQRQAARPVLQAAGLRHQEEQRALRQRQTLERQADSVQLAAGATKEALLRQQAQPQPIPRKPQTPADWVTVMRAQAEQIEGRVTSAREVAQFSALQRQVAQTLVQGFRADRRPVQERHDNYAAHLVALQRHPSSAPVAGAVLGLIPQGERPALQRAVDLTLQREKAQTAQDQQTLEALVVQRQLAELEAETTQPMLQRLQARRGGGNPLPAAVRRHLEQGLNHDLSRVRIHDDAEADKLAKGVNSIAFTTGTDIFFRRGQFNPNTRTGLELLAHEVTHTVQQSRGQVGTGIDPDAGLENEARRMGRRLSSMESTTRTSPFQRFSQQSPLTTHQAVQRQTAPTTSSPALNQTKLLQLRRLLTDYHDLRRSGRLSPAELRTVQQAVERANTAVRAAEQVAGRGASVKSAAGMVAGSTAILVGDDVTGIGVADDVAIPFVLLAAGGLYLLARGMQSSSASQEQSWAAANAAVDAAVATVGSTVLMAKKNKATTQAPPVVVATTRTAERDRRETHRGRLQVQGTDLSNFPSGELSWAWTRSTPPSATDSIVALQAMKVQLSKRQLAVRTVAFTKAEARILNLQAQGGVSARWVKTFQNDNLPSDLKSARVDIEVLEGKAFI
jgi:hypothetical protein